MAARYGAHEVMETHEVLSNAINAINQFQMFRPFVRDQQLAAIMDKHLQFAVQEYNNMVQSIKQRGMGESFSFSLEQITSPQYGLNNPTPQTPNVFGRQITDRDIASSMLGTHKLSAIMRMMACVECADPELRQIIQQGANNCAIQAYEVWQYMNAKGYYQVPTMKDVTTNTMIQSYNTTNMGQAPLQQ